MDDTVAARRPGRPKGEGREKGSRNKPYERLFRHGDVARAIKAGKAGGLGQFKVDIDKSGKISLVPMESGNPAGEQGANEWQERMKKLGLDDGQ